MKHKFLIYYIFIEELNEIIIKNISILKNKKYRLNIITSNKNIYQISKFAKISKIPFYVCYCAGGVWAMTPVWVGVWTGEITSWAAVAAGWVVVEGV